MSAGTPRLRMFAGPNGSGKSTLKSYLPAELLGIYLNPDEIELGIRNHGFLDFSAYDVAVTPSEVLDFFQSSRFLRENNLAATARLSFAKDRLDFAKVAVNSYFASVATDLLLQKLVARKISFTFETVMSHESKVDLLA